ncbi:MAG: hypothetical protein M1142_01020 [Patescibacteria group bacterium]|nr:hypothetical protein [Patescibacteria group bacterium]
MGSKNNPSQPLTQEAKVVSKPEVSTTPSSDETASWKIFTSSRCSFNIKTPKDWKTEDVKLVPGNNNQGYQYGCGGLYAPDYKTALDSRGGFWIYIDRTRKGTIFKSITINSLEDYIKTQENITDPPTLVKNKIEKTYGDISGVQFEPQVGFEALTVFTFSDNGNIYSISWPSSYEGIYKNYLNQILSTLKFLDQGQTIDTSNWKTYLSNKYKYSFKYPDNWFLVFSETDQKLYDKSPQTLGPAYTISFFVANSQGGVKRSDPIGSRQEVADKVFEEKIGDIEIDGTKGIKIKTEVLNGSQTDTPPSIGIKIPLQEGNLYVNLMCFESKCESYKNLFDQIISTLKFN